MRWSRAEYEASPRRLLRPASRLKPAVWAVSTPNEAFIVKDLRACPRPWRAFARWLRAREARALTRLAGVARVPQLVHAIDRDARVLSCLPGEPMRAGHTPGGPRAIADKLLELLAQVHARGVYHLDLRHKRNVLVDESGAVSLVDFGAAITLPSWAISRLGPLFAGIDRAAALKYVARWEPSSLTENEARTVRRRRRLRRLWFFSRHAPPAGEAESLAARLSAPAERQVGGDAS